MTREIENIIINKKFFELTLGEKELIREYAETESDFEQLKYVFTQLEDVKLKEKPHVDNGVKVSLDALFDKTYTQKRLVWYNKLWLFLWPEETRFYARPIVQFATVLVLIVTVVTLVPFNQKEKIAMNEVDKQQIESSQPVTEVKSEEAKVETVNEDAELFAEEELVKEEVVQEMESELGWTLSEEAVALKDDFNKEQAVPAMDSDYSGAIQQPMPALNRLDVSVDEVLVNDVAVDALSTKSVTRLRSKAYSAKENPEVFDILTALY